MGYYYDGGNPPNEETNTITTNEGIKVGAPAEIKMDNNTKEMLWQVMDENTKLKTELMMVNAKLEQIKRLL